MTEAAMQTREKAMVVRAGGTAEPHAASAVASRFGWLRRRPSIQIESKEGPRAGPDARLGIRRYMWSLSNGMRRKHASAGSLQHLPCGRLGWANRRAYVSYTAWSAYIGSALAILTEDCSLVGHGLCWRG